MEDHEPPTSPSANGASSDDRLPPLASTMFKSSWDNASIRASSIKEKEKDRKKSFSLPRAGHFPILGEKHLITVMGAKTVIPSKERRNNPLIGHVAPEFRLKDQKERWTVSMAWRGVAWRGVAWRGAAAVTLPPGAADVSRTGGSSRCTPLLRLVAQSSSCESHRLIQAEVIQRRL
ncbi:hypothetical protein IE81DRAFT_27059 [Ceraceosorus guamensis]|uniref:Uncharacterized protein n=1 Tax=Ceraceosorus guamensis TaxID=1522189 RepID=A0A316VPB7_9BASI|nr:hypothetical protein IE81DRAFT_27059 [Ceraceosorus guamensis]PWN39416.1 hypothetical protein IE81DRAFT_27059 [Ceraceosorus guamensis]